MSEGELTVFQTQSLGPLLHVESRSTAISGIARLVVPSVDERSVTGFSCTDAVAMVLLPSLREAHRQRQRRMGIADWSSSVRTLGLTWALFLSGISSPFVVHVFPMHDEGDDVVLGGGSTFVLSLPASDEPIEEVA